MRYTFGKRDRLKSRKAIELLFKEGTSLKAYPLRLIYRTVPRQAPNDAPIKGAVSAPAKNFRKAHQRNLLKRRMRESFRLRRHKIELSDDLALDLMVIYMAREILPYQTIDQSMHKLIENLCQKLNRNS